MPPHVFLRVSPLLSVAAAEAARRHSRCLVKNVTCSGLGLRLSRVPGVPGADVFGGKRPGSPGHVVFTGQTQV